MKYLLILFSLALTTSAFAQQRMDGAFMLWDNLLQEYVDSQGNVNYRGLKADPTFARTISAFQKMDPENTEWSEAKKLAFWINAYNAFTVKLICDNYPLKSITNLKEPWDKKWIVIDEVKYSLNQIENEIIRPRFKDARVHFAINCASVSCPPLHNRAFIPETLNRMLDQLTRNFINNPDYNTVTAEKVEISKVFEWYAEDFEGRGGLIGFLNRFTTFRINADAEVVFNEYNWKLNGR